MDSTDKSIILRKPTLKDAVAIHSLVQKSPPLDVNSVYCYLLLCDHFHNSCVIAEHESRIVGCITAYIPPEKPDILFVWQVVVDESMRNRSLATKMLNDLVGRKYYSLVSYIETTVTPSNEASMRFFQAFARGKQATFVKETCYTKDLFGNYNHEEELLIRIGPFATGQTQ